MFHFHTGTMTRRSEKLDQEVPEAYVEIHPKDAAQHWAERLAAACA